MSSLVRISKSVVLLIKKFVHKEEDFKNMFLDFPEGTDFNQQARDFVTQIEDETCVAFWEALILQSKKAINRDALWCMENSNKDPKDGPEWWTKYQDSGT